MLTSIARPGTSLVDDTEVGTDDGCQAQEAHCVPVIQEVADIDDEASEIALLIHWIGEAIRNCVCRSGAGDSATAPPPTSSRPSGNWCSSPATT
jgi:hypothetical protein